MKDGNPLSVKQVHSIQAIDASAWNALTDNTPLLSHTFLLALENSQSVGPQSGWHPNHIAIYNNQDQLLGAMPLYLKTHSYGEYVFDWSWADAYERNQTSYYPKLVSAIPFSPVTSNRLLSRNQEISHLLIDAIDSLLLTNQLSSAHILFPNTNDSEILSQKQWLKRQGVQFRWENKSYENFDAFLATLSHNKRKKIKQERKKVLSADVQCRYVLGSDATPEDWDFFYTCYCNTYIDHHSSPYLTRAFFEEISTSLAGNILLIIAERNDQAIACTLNFYNDHTLFGRYWGSTEFVSCLHFELCYYQAQSFCIERGIQFFEGGAQGEHKLARGFEPRPTCSYHRISDPRFESAIEEFLKQEADGMAAYTNELEERVPFKKLPVDL